MDRIKLLLLIGGRHVEQFVKRARRAGLLDDEHFNDVWQVVRHTGNIPEELGEIIEEAEEANENLPDDNNDEDGASNDEDDDNDDGGGDDGHSRPEAQIEDVEDRANAGSGGHVNDNVENQIDVFNQCISRYSRLRMTNPIDFQTLNEESNRSVLSAFDLQSLSAPQFFNILQRHPKLLVLSTTSNPIAQEQQTVQDDTNHNNATPMSQSNLSEIIVSSIETPSDSFPSAASTPSSSATSSSAPKRKRSVSMQLIETRKKIRTDNGIGASDSTSNSHQTNPDWLNQPSTSHQNVVEEPSTCSIDVFQSLNDYLDSSDLPAIDEIQPAADDKQPAVDDTQRIVEIKLIDEDESVGEAKVRMKYLIRNYPKLTVVSPDNLKRRENFSSPKQHRNIAPEYSRLVSNKKKLQLLTNFPNL